jgi:hypothetical protein
MTTKYEVQEFNLCGGWANNWTYEQDGVYIPTQFDSELEARASLDEFFNDMDAEFEAGNMPDVPDAEDFRIVEVQNV